MYEAADQSWRGRPLVISPEVIAQAARRIADHAAAHSLPAVQVILHGGEPLLAGPVRLRQIITTLRAALDGICDLDLRIHTNGVLLNERFCALSPSIRSRSAFPLTATGPRTTAIAATPTGAAAMAR